MKRIRIGNTIQLRWAIYEKAAGNPVPYNLSGRTLKVYLQGLFKPDIEITDFGVSDNVLSVTFEGKDQKVLGGYTLLLIENPDDYSMRAVDFVKAFELVPHTVNDEDVEPVNNLEVVVLDLDTTVDFGSGGGSITIDSQLSTSSRNAVQNRVVTAAINAKQGTIEDLEQIRQGASKGATALQKEQYTGTYSKPTSGIPKSDLASDVQASLNKANTAVQDISGKQDKITDLEAIRSNAQAGKTASSNIGTVANLNTDAKLLVDAINEVLSKIGSGGGGSSSNAGVVSVKEVTANSGYLQTFQVLQSGAVVGTINISKELKPKVITADMLADGVAVSGPQGPQGVGVSSVKQTTTSSADGGSNIVTVTLTNGTTSTFTVKNGSKGSKGDTGPQGPQGEQGPQGIQGVQGVQGNNGITFTPSVDSEGNLSWSNNGVLPNPSTVNIRGPKGTDDVVFIKVDDIFSEEPIRITLEDYENMLNKNVVILEPGSFWFEESRSDINSDSFSIFLNANRGGQIQVADFLVQKNESYAEILPGEYWKGYDLESIKSNYWQDEYGTEGGEYGILPNIFYKWDEVASLSITLDADDGEEGIVDEYIFQFISGATPTILSLPADIQWYKDEAPTIEANMVYQISIINNLGVWGAFPSAS